MEQFYLMERSFMSSRRIRVEAVDTLGSRGFICNGISAFVSGEPEKYGIQMKESIYEKR